MTEKRTHLNPGEMIIGLHRPSDARPYCAIDINGDTYPHREGLKAAGWSWNAEFGQWERKFEGKPTPEAFRAMLADLKPLEAHFYPGCLDADRWLKR